MELELGLKVTRTREDVSSSVDFRFSKDPFGPLVLSRETDSRFIIIIHLKGFKKEGIEIDINEEGDRITIRGRKPVEEMVMIRWMAWRKEVEMRAFRKVFLIPDVVDLDKIKARFDDDDATLTIIMPKRVRGISGFNLEQEEEEEEEENVEREESDEHSEIQEEEDFGEMVEGEERESQVYEGEEEGFSGGVDETQHEDDDLEEIQQTGQQELADSDRESEDSGLKRLPDIMEQEDNQKVKEQKVSEETKSGDTGSGATEEIEEEEEESHEDNVLEKLLDIMEEEDNQEVVKKKVSEETKSGDIRSGAIEEIQEQESDEDGGLEKLLDIIEQEDSQEVMEQKVSEETKSGDIGSGAVEETEEQESDEDSGLIKLPDIIDQEGNQKIREQKVSEQTKNGDIRSGAVEEIEKQESEKNSGSNPESEGSGLTKLPEFMKQEDNQEVMEKRVSESDDTESGALGDIEEQESDEDSDFEKLPDTMEQEDNQEVIEQKVSEETKSGDIRSGATEEIEKQESDEDSGLAKLPDIMEQEVMEHKVSEDTRSEDIGSRAVEEIEEQESDEVDGTSKSREMEKKKTDGGDDDGLRKAQGIEEPERHNEESKIQEMVEEDTSGQKKIKNKETQTGDDNLEKSQQTDEAETVGQHEFADPNTESKDSVLRKLPDTLGQEHNQDVMEKKDSQEDTRSDGFGSAVFEEIEKEELHEQLDGTSKGRKKADDDGLRKVKGSEEPEKHKEASNIQEMVERDPKEDVDAEMGKGFTPNVERTPVVAETETKAEELESEITEADKVVGRENIKELVEEKAPEAETYIANDVPKPVQETEAPEVATIIKRDDERKEKKKSVEIKNMGEGSAPNNAETETEPEDFESEKLGDDEVDKIHKQVEKKEEEEDATVRAKGEDSILTKLQENVEQHSKGQKGEEKQEYIKELDEENAPEAETNTVNDVPKPVQENKVPEVGTLGEVMEQKVSEESKSGDTGSGAVAEIEEQESDEDSGLEKLPDIIEKVMEQRVSEETKSGETGSGAVKEMEKQESDEVGGTSKSRAIEKKSTDGAGLRKAHGTEEPESKITGGQEKNAKEDLEKSQQTDEDKSVGQQEFDDSVTESEDSSILRKPPDILEQGKNQDEKDSQEETRSDDFGSGAFEEIDDDGLSKVQGTEEPERRNEVSKIQEMVEGETSDHEKRKIVKMETESKDPKEDVDADMGERFTQITETTRVVAEDNIAKTEELESEKPEADKVDKKHELVEKKEEEEGDTKDVRRESEDRRSLIKLQENEEPEVDTVVRTDDEGKEKKKKSVEMEINNMGEGIAPNTAETETKPEDIESEKLGDDEVEKIHKLVEKIKKEDANVKRKSEDRSLIELQEDQEPDSKGRKRQDKQEDINELVEEKAPEAETSIENDVPKQVQDMEVPNIVETETPPDEYESDKQEADEAEKIHKLVEKKEEEDEENAEVGTQSEDIISIKPQGVGEQQSQGQKRQEKIKELVEEKTQEAEAAIENDTPKPVQEETNDAESRKPQETVRQQELDECEKESKTQELVKSKTNDEEKEIEETVTEEKDSYRPTVLGEEEEEEEEKVQELSKEKTDFSKNGKFKEGEEITEKKTELGDYDDISRKAEDSDSQEETDAEMGKRFSTSIAETEIKPEDNESEKQGADEFGKIQKPVEKNEEEDANVRAQSEDRRSLIKVQEDKEPHSKGRKGQEKQETIKGLVDEKALEAEKNVANDILEPVQETEPEVGTSGETDDTEKEANEKKKIASLEVSKRDVAETEKKTEEFESDQLKADEVDRIHELVEKKKEEEEEKNAKIEELVEEITPVAETNIGNDNLKPVEERGEGKEKVQKFIQEEAKKQPEEHKEKMVVTGEKIDDAGSGKVQQDLNEAERSSIERKTQEVLKSKNNDKEKGIEETVARDQESCRPKVGEEKEEEEKVQELAEEKPHFSKNRKVKEEEETPEKKTELVDDDEISRKVGDNQQLDSVAKEEVDAEMGKGFAPNIEEKAPESEKNIANDVHPPVQEIETEVGTLGEAGGEEEKKSATLDAKEEFDVKVSVPNTAETETEPDEFVSDELKSDELYKVYELVEKDDEKNAKVGIQSEDISLMKPQEIGEEQSQGLKQHHKQEKIEELVEEKTPEEETKISNATLKPVQERGEGKQKIPKRPQEETKKQTHEYKERMAETGKKIDDAQEIIRQQELDEDEKEFVEKETNEQEKIQEVAEEKKTEFSSEDDHQISRKFGDAEQRDSDYKEEVYGEMGETVKKPEEVDKRHELVQKKKEERESGDSSLKGLQEQKFQGPNLHDKQEKIKELVEEKQEAEKVQETAKPKVEPLETCEEKVFAETEAKDQESYRPKILEGEDKIQEKMNVSRKVEEEEETEEKETELGDDGMSRKSGEIDSMKEQEEKEEIQEQVLEEKISDSAKKIVGEAIIAENDKSRKAQEFDEQKSHEEDERGSQIQELRGGGGETSGQGEAEGVESEKETTEVDKRFREEIEEEKTEGFGDDHHKISRRDSDSKEGVDVEMGRGMKPNISETETKGEEFESKKLEPDGNDDVHKVVEKKEEEEKNPKVRRQREDRRSLTELQENERQHSKRQKRQEKTAETETNIPTPVQETSNEGKEEKKKSVTMETKDSDAKEEFDAKNGKGFAPNTAETETKPEELESDKLESDLRHELVEKKEEKEEDNAKTRGQGEDSNLSTKIQETKEEKQDKIKELVEEKTPAAEETMEQESCRPKVFGDDDHHVSRRVGDTGERDSDAKEEVDPEMDKGSTVNISESEKKAEEFETDTEKAVEEDRIQELAEKKKEENATGRKKSEDTGLKRLQEEKFQGPDRHSKQEKTRELVEEKPVQETERPEVRTSETCKEKVFAETETKDQESYRPKILKGEDKIQELAEEKMNFSREFDEEEETAEKKTELGDNIEQRGSGEMKGQEEKVSDGGKGLLAETYKPRKVQETDDVEQQHEEDKLIGGETSGHGEEDEDVENGKKTTEEGDKTFSDIATEAQEIERTDSDVSGKYGEGDTFQEVQEEEKEDEADRQERGTGSIEKEQDLSEPKMDHVNKIEDFIEENIAESEAEDERGGLSKVKELHDPSIHKERDRTKTSGTEVPPSSQETITDKEERPDKPDSHEKRYKINQLVEAEQDDHKEEQKDDKLIVKEKLETEEDTGEKAQELVDENINNCKEEETDTKTDDAITKVHGIKEQERSHGSEVHGSEEEESHEPNIHKERYKINITEKEEPSGQEEEEKEKNVEYMTITETKNQRPDKDSNEKQYKIQELVEAGLKDHKEEQRDERLTVKAKQEAEEETSKMVQETEQQGSGGLSGSLVQDKKQETEEKEINRAEERRTKTEDPEMSKPYKREEEDKIQEPVEMGKSGYKEKVKKQDGNDISRIQEPGKDEIERHGEQKSISQGEENIQEPVEMRTHDYRERAKNQDSGDIPQSVEEENVENMAELERKVDGGSSDKFHERREKRKDFGKEEEHDPKESEETKQVEEKETVERRRKNRDGSLRKVQDDAEPEVSKPFNPQEEDKVHESVEETETSDFSEGVKKQDGDDTLRRKEEATGPEDKRTAENVIAKAELQAEEDTSEKIQEIEKQKKAKMQETEEKEKTRAVEENEIEERRTTMIGDGKEAESSKPYKRQDEDKIQELEKMKTSDYREKVKKQDGDDILRSQEREKLDLLEEEATGPKDEHTGGKEEPAEEEIYEKVVQTETKFEDEINKEVEENQKEEGSSLDDPMTMIQESDKDESHEPEIHIVQDFVEEETRDQEDKVPEDAAAVDEENHGEDSSRILQTIKEQRLDPEVEGENEERIAEKEAYDDWTQQQRGMMKDLVKEEALGLKHTGGEGHNDHKEEQHEEQFIPKAEVKAEEESSEHESDELQRSLGQDKMQETEEKGKARAMEENETVEGRRKTEDGSLRKVQEGDRVGEAEAEVATNEKDSSKKLQTTDVEELKEQEEQDEIPATGDPRVEDGYGERVAEKETKVEKVHVQEPEGKTENKESRRGQKGKQEDKNVETKSDDGIVRKVGETKVQESDEKKKEKIEEPERKEASDDGVKVDTEEGSLIGGQEFIEKESSKRKPVGQENIQQLGKQEDEEKSEAGVEMQAKIKEENGIERSEKVAEVEMQAKIGIRIKEKETKRQELYELLEDEEHDKIPEPVVEGTKYQREEEKRVEDREAEDNEDVSSRKFQKIKGEESDGLEKHRKLSELQEKQSVEEEEELNEAGGYKEVLKTKSMEDSRQSQDVEEKGSDQTERHAEQESIQEQMAKKEEEAQRISQVEPEANDDSSKKNDTERRWRGQEQKKDHQEMVEVETSEQRKEEREEKIVDEAVSRDEYDCSMKNHENQEEQSEKLERHGEEEMSGLLAKEETSNDKEENRGNRAGAETTIKDDGFREEQLEIVLRHSEQDKKQLGAEKDTSGKAKDKRNQETKSRDDSLRKTEEDEKQESHEQKRNYEEQDKKNMGQDYYRNEEDGKEDKETPEAEGIRKQKGIEQREATKMVESHEYQDNVTDLVEEKMNNQEKEDKESLAKSEDSESKELERLRKEDKGSELVQQISTDNLLDEETKLKEKESSKTHQLKEKETCEEEKLTEKESRETECEDDSSKKIQEIYKEALTEPRRDEERDKIQPVDSETSEDDSEELEVEVEDSEEDWEAEVIQEMDSDEDNDEHRKIRRIKLGFRLVGGSTLFMSLIVIVISIIRSKRKTRCYKF